MSDRRALSTTATRLRAASIHVLTALGTIPALLAFVAILDGDPAMALVWLGVTLVIDGLDGPLARRFEVARALPGIDGAVLDHVIDYMTYALIPAIFLYQFQLLPEALNLAGAGFVMLTSLYCFANKAMKTKDNFFSGFPAAWNFAVLYFYLLDSNPWLNVAVVLLCGVLTFVPLKFIHPFRVVRFRQITVAITLAWAGLAVYLVLLSRTQTELMQAAPAAFWSFVAISFWFAGVSLWRTWRGKLD